MEITCFLTESSEEGRAFAEAQARYGAAESVAVLKRSPGGPFTDRRKVMLVARARQALSELDGVGTVGCPLPQEPSIVGQVGAAVRRERPETPSAADVRSGWNSALAVIHANVGSIRCTVRAATAMRRAGWTSPRNHSRGARSLAGSTGSRTSDETLPIWKGGRYANATRGPMRNALRSGRIDSTTLGGMVMITLHRTPRPAVLLVLVFVCIGWASAQSEAAPAETHTFSPAVFAFDVAPDGRLLVAENTTVKEVRSDGVTDLVDIPALEGVPINGLAAIDDESFFAASGGLDLAEGAGLWLVVGDDARLVGDIEAFETEHDPDAFEGPEWKTPACEEPEFSAGPQSNPYHLTVLSDREALVADAAGNTLLYGNAEGEVDWVALFTPPVDEDGFRVLYPLDDDTDCYVQPVPTSVAVGPDGAYYVGELTGITAEEIAGDVVTGSSRVWRVEPGARNVVCPSADCEVVVSDLTAVIDLAFGPDGDLYVVEFDQNGWFTAVEADPPDPAGGAIQNCDVGTGECEVVVDGLVLPGAITFDEEGNLWLLESGILEPVVRVVER